MLEKLIVLWKEYYGEDFKEKYYGIYNLLSNTTDLTLEDFCQEWQEYYRENFEEEYKGIYEKLK